MNYEEASVYADSINKEKEERLKNNPVPTGQKYPPGTRVKIADDLGHKMNHFPKGELATVKYTYAHAYGGDDYKFYCLDVDGVGEISWYYEWQLSPIDDETSINYEQLGQEIGKLVNEKQIAYGDSFHKSGEVMKILYPNGIIPEQMEDALAVVRIIDKLFRIATSKNAYGESPFKDIAGYGILGCGKQ